MINHCATKNIAVEIIPITTVNEAWKRVVAKDVRYCFVIGNGNATYLSPIRH